MADKAKGPVVLLIILLLIAVAAAVIGFIGLQKEKETNTLLSEKVEQLEVKKRQVEKQAADLKEQVDTLRQEIIQQQTKVNDLTASLGAANNALTLEKEAKENALTEMAKIKAEADSLTAAKSNLEAQLKTNIEALGSLKNQLNVIETTRQRLEQKLKNKDKDSETNAAKDTLQETKPKDVQLDKIVISSALATEQSQQPKQQAEVAAQAAAPQGPLEGRVLVVNKEYGFIVINLGQKDNIAIADTFEVLRKEKKIGEVKVEEVRDTMSVATPVTKDMIKQVKEDDRILRK